MIDIRLEAAKNVAAMLPRTFETFGSQMFGPSAANEAKAAIEAKAAMSGTPKAEPTNNNSLTASPLWQVVSQKAAETVSREIASIMPYVTDVRTDLQVRDPQALPIVKVPVYSGTGEALINATNWEQSEVTNTYVDIQTVRVSRPAFLSTYDMANGEQMERIITVLMRTVAQGVYEQFLSACIAANETPTAYPALTPESARALSAIFGDQRVTHGLFLSPAQYANLIPYQTIGIDPKNFGAFGIENIARTSMMGNDIDGLAIAREGVAGLVGVPEVLFNMGGMDVYRLPDVAGIPMLLKTHFNYGRELLMVSVESLCGFSVLVPGYVKTLTFGRASS